jgi:hypothetical protein
MQGHYHAAVWIDHRQARIFHFNANDVVKLLIHSHDAPQHLHHKANSIGSGHSPEDRGYLEDVTKAITDAGAVLVAGPSGEKNELVKHIKHRHPQVAGKIEGVETVDHPTDGEFVAYARKYLKSADRMRPQV